MPVGQSLNPETIYGYLAGLDLDDAVLPVASEVNITDRVTPSALFFVLS